LHEASAGRHGGAVRRAQFALRCIKINADKLAVLHHGAACHHQLPHVGTIAARKQ
jgi:hypothetical protein